MPEVPERLTDQQKRGIYSVIYDKKATDDPEPRDVITSQFGDDEEVYLRYMAKWHGINIESL